MDMNREAIILQKRVTRANLHLRTEAQIWRITCIKMSIVHSQQGITTFVLPYYSNDKRKDSICAQIKNTVLAPIYSRISENL